MAGVAKYIQGEKKSFLFVHTWRLLDLKFSSILVPQHISWWIFMVIIILTMILVNPNGSLHFSSHTSYRLLQLWTHTAEGNSSTTLTSRKYCRYLSGKFELMHLFKTLNSNNNNSVLKPSKWKKLSVINDNMALMNSRKYQFQAENCENIC